MGATTASRGVALPRWASAGAPFATGDALWWTLRVGAALCFIGHGAFGVLTKPAWVPYFAVAGIGHATAFRLMPLVGIVDIVLGVLTLVRPRPALVVYLACWALWTAALRPLAGEPGWETVERAGNYGVPLALLLLARPLGAAPSAGRVVDWSGWRSWLAPAVPGPLTPARVRRVRLVLGLTTAALLLGHGMLALHGKPALVTHAALWGLPIPAGTLARLLGGVEVALAALVLWRPTPGLALGVAGWKLVTESLFLVAGAPIWEVVERGGSYAAPIALAVRLWHTRAARPLPDPR